MGNLAHKEWPSGVPERVYLEIELDPRLGTKVEDVAEEQNVTPFGLCVALLREAVDARTNLPK